MIAVTIAASSVSVPRPLTNERSTFSMSSGKRFSDPSDEWPVPNSSIDSFTPRPFSGPQGRAGAVRVVDHHALGDLEAQRFGFRARLGQDALHQVDQAGIAVLARGQVDRHLQRRSVVRAPGPRLQAGLAQGQLADLGDQAGLLGKPQELGRLDHAALGVVPSQQGLEADDLAAAQVDLGLVQQPELTLLDRAVQIGLGARARPHAAAHAVVEDLVGDCPGALRGTSPRRRCGPGSRRSRRGRC